MWLPNPADRSVIIREKSPYVLRTSHEGCNRFLTVSGWTSGAENLIDAVDVPGRFGGVHRPVFATIYRYTRMYIYISFVTTTCARCSVIVIGGVDLPRTFTTTECAHGVSAGAAVVAADRKDRAIPTPALPSPGQRPVSPAQPSVRGGFVWRADARRHGRRSHWMRHPAPNVPHARINHR